LHPHPYLPPPQDKIGIRYYNLFVLIRVELSTTLAFTVIFPGEGLRRSIDEPEKCP